MLEISISKARSGDRLPIYRMLDLYQYELSDIWDQDLDLHGEYGYSLDRFWSNKACIAYVARVAGNYAGFALTHDDVVVGPGGKWMDQFFVLKKYRRQGLGYALAAKIFSDSPGQWEIGQMSANHAARLFWQSVVGKITGEHYAEFQVSEGWWQGSVQRFISVGSE